MTATQQPPFRCSTASRALAEPQAGTASTVRAFLLVETPGPWGYDAVADSRLSSSVKHLLGGLEPSSGVRPLLIRRPGRSVAGPVRVLAAYADPAQPWLETTTLPRVEDLIHLDLAALGRGGSLGLLRSPGPVFAVCSHGRHDACCAERGRPLAAALASVAPEQTWEVSHIGGDRFAANVLVLPQGLYYGRVAAEEADAFAADHVEGRLDLLHLRGRSAYPFAVQVAEIALRRRLGELRLDAVQLLDRTRVGPVTSAVFTVDGQRWTVRVETQGAAARRLTCRSGTENVAPGYRVLDVLEVLEG